MDESRPFKVGHDKDRIRTLPDELILEILERLSLREAVRAGAVSTRWRHLPHQLSRLDLGASEFQGTTPLEAMDVFTAALCRLLLACPPPAERKCDCKSRRALKTLSLRFYLSAPHLSSIGRTVEDTVSRGETESLEFGVIPTPSDLTGRTELGQQFMSFSRACPIAFRWLTGLFLDFGESDLPTLMAACDKLKHLSLIYCSLDEHSVLKIDVPNSVMCDSWDSENPPLRFGYVPELCKVTLACHAGVWQAPFALSDCFSLNTINLSTLSLIFSCQMIWIQPEHPKQQLTAIFCNLTDLELWFIFPECDLSWTLFILEDAPALQMFTVNRTRHSCAKTSEVSAQKANVMWEPSKDLKHLNLKSLVMMGFEEEDKVTNYIRLVMARAVGLNRIMLRGTTCKACDAIDLDFPKRYQVDEASRRRIKERLRHGISSSVNIIIDDVIIDHGSV